MNKKLFFSSLCVIWGLAGCSSIQSLNSEARRVGHVKWYKQKAVDALTLSQRGVPKDSVGIFFYRMVDADPLQTSANIAVNDRFQVSLQPGHFTQVYSCSGVNDISADITGNKNNDLLRGLTSQIMEAGENYYFSVDVAENRRITVQQISEKVALDAMRHMNMQAHQVSRVVPDCPKNIPARIELKVLFDTNESLVKENYYPEIQRVSDYMKQYPNTKVVIEGHTDNRATAQYNMALSQRRVDAVKNVLVNSFGVETERLQAVGFGESRPAETNDTEMGRQQNRRVIAVFKNNL